MPSRLRAGLAILRWRESRLRMGACPFCGPTVLLRLNISESGVRCLRCAASLVHLSIGWVLRQQVADLGARDACEFSARGPLTACLRREARSLACSEYFAGVPSGNYRDGVRCEDVQRLSYADESFDLVTHSEVLEHVPDDAPALRELYRVLRPGGLMLFSVPLSDRDRTLERARVDTAGHIEHLTEPMFHHDPLRDEGILAFRDYGRDLLQRLSVAGFEDCRCVHPAVRSPWIAWRPVFVAQKIPS